MASTKEKMRSQDAKSRESPTDFGVNRYGKHTDTQRCTFFFFSPSLESAQKLSLVQGSSVRPGVGVGDRKSQREQSKKLSS